MYESDGSKIHDGMIDLSLTERHLFHVANPTVPVDEVNAPRVMNELLERQKAMNRRIVTHYGNAMGFVAEAALHALRVRRFSRVAGEILAYQVEQHLRQQSHGQSEEES